MPWQPEQTATTRQGLGADRRDPGTVVKVASGPCRVVNAQADAPEAEAATDLQNRPVYVNAGDQRRPPHPSLPGEQARDERGQSSPPGERPGPTTTAGGAGQNEEQHREL